MHSTMTAVVIHGLRLARLPWLVGLLGSDASGLGCDDTRGEVTASAGAEPTAAAARTWVGAVVGAIVPDLDTAFWGDTRCGRSLAARGEAELGEIERGEAEPREAEPGDGEPGEAEPGDDVPGEGQSDDDSVAMPSATLLSAALMIMGS